MKTINRKPLFLALAGITALGAVGTAQAVSVNPTGLGGVLLYPYYTVKGTTNPYNTLLSIVNTTESVKAVKIRFHEGKASAEVLDFNIFLSPYDMWTASLEPSASGGVKLFTGDHSCTIPTIPATGVEFRNTRYATDAANDASLARLREGYFEVIEMATFTDGSTIAINATHNATGFPKDCTKVTTPTAENEQQSPQGGLSGTASLVSPGSGLNAATDPTPLVNFTDIPIYFGTNEDDPTLNNAVPWSVTPTNDGNSVWAQWNNGADAVSAALMKSAIINEFVLDVATDSATDWVITFPTKNFYVPQSGALPLALFSKRLTPSGSCDPVVVTTWDREEQTKTPGGPDFSPAPPEDVVSLCWEANVLTFNNKNIFGSTNTLGISTLFPNGWARIDFRPTGTPLASTTTVGLGADAFSPFTTGTTAGTYTGLPVIGFAVQTFRPTLTSSYAGTFYHRWLSGAAPEPFNSAQ